MYINSFRQSWQPEVVRVALTEWIGKGLTRYFLIGVAVAFFCFLGDSYRPVQAEAESIVVDMSVYGQVEYGDFFRRAEAIARDEIRRQFSQNPDLADIQVVVVGDRNGEIVPILTTTVSRTQWQDTPRVSVWTKHYHASYMLLQHHQGQPTETVAKTPVRATIGTQRPSPQIDQALDEGRLTGAEAQDYLDELN
jgi:hypothetical protein